MAKNYKKIYEDRYGGSTQSDKLQNQINNYSARLAASGVNPEEATDDRNALEKALNLDQNQGFIQDISELINRPQQAIFTGIKNAQEGGDFFEGFGEGITGNEETQFKEILMNTGAFEDTEGKLNLVDVLGFAGDVLLDPVDLIPVAGWAKAADTLADTGSLLKAYKATDSLSDLTFKTAGKVVKGGAKIADKGIEAGLKAYDATRGVKNSAGDLVKLGYETPNMKSAANLRPYLLDATQDMKGAKGTFQTYKGIKEGFNNIFNVSDAAKKAERLRREVSSSAETATEASALKIREMQKAAQEFSEKTGGKYGDANQLLNDARMMLESVTNRTLTEEEVLSKALSGDMPGYPEAVEHLNKMLNRDTSKKVRNEIKQRLGKNALDIEITKTGKINLGDGWKELEFSKPKDNSKQLNNLINKRDWLLSMNDAQDMVNNGIYPDEFDEMVKKISDDIKNLKASNNNNLVVIGRNYTPEQEQYLFNLGDRYGNNRDGFRDFVDSIFGTDWKKQDSGIYTTSDYFDRNYDDYYYNISSIDELRHKEMLKDLSPEMLSKNQALLLDTEELYTGRGANRTTITPTLESGEVGTKANSKFLTDSADMATDYGGDLIATPENLNNNEKVIYRGLLPKTNEDNILSVGANGIMNEFNDGKDYYVHNPDPNYDWTNLPVKDFDTYNTLKGLSNDSFTELQSLFDRSDNNARNFYNLLKKEGSKKLKSDLKKNKLDINSVDRPAGYAQYDLVHLNDSTYNLGHTSYNIDSDTLFKVLKDSKNIDGTYSMDFGLSTLIGSSGYSSISTDMLVDRIYNNQRLGRSSHNFNTISLGGIKDNGTGQLGGIDIITFNPGPNVTPRNYKSIYNKTPLLETEDIYDLEENAKEAIRGGVNLYNDFVDEFLGTNLSSKYTNTDYVMGHTLTKEGKSLSDAFKKFNNERVSKGNSSLLNSRKYVGSVEETNNYIRDVVNKIPDDELKDYPEILEFKHNKDAKFMEPDFAKSITNSYADYFGVTGLARDTKVVSDTLLNDTFSNYDELVKVQNDLNIASKSGKSTDELANKYTKLINDAAIKPLSNADNNIPKGFTVLSGNELADYINKYVKINGQLGNTNTAKQLKKLANKVIKNGNDVAINSDVLRIIGFASDKKTTSELSDLYSTYLNFFKKWKTASPTNFLNNLIGNSSNLALGGVSVADQARLGPKVLDIMQNGKKYHLQRLAGDVLDDSANEIADLWEQYRKMGFGDASLDLAELPEDLRDIIKGNKKLNGPIDYAKDGLPALFGYLNQKGDNVSRLTIMLKSMEDPSFLKRLGATDTYDAISKIMFDPTMLTSSEKKIKQVIPFYSYAKNNLVYQVANMQNNGHKYNQLMKGVKSLQKSATDGNEENMTDYLKSSLYIPIPGIGKDGEYTMLRASLPFGQLIEAVDDPFQTLTNSLSPMVKAPIEYATGIDSFTGREIESFPGEKSSQIPFLTKKQQKFLSDFTGLDVPLKGVSRISEGIKDSENGVLSGIGQGLRNNIMMDYSVDTDKLNRQYEDLDALQTLMKQYEQQGYEFATLTELKEANKNKTIQGLDAIFAKYGIE